MTQLIDKEAVAAEIERISAYYDSLHEQRIIKKILSIIDTPEVKEVDLEKELENLIKKDKAFITDDREVKYYNGDSYNHIYELEFIAKYFFELGLKTQKGE